jgi:hypothetical protein
MTIGNEFTSKEGGVGELFAFICSVYKDGTLKNKIAVMKQISEVEEKSFTSSLNINPEACCGGVEVTPSPLSLILFPS